MSDDGFFGKARCRRLHGGGGPAVTPLLSLNHDDETTGLSLLSSIFL